MSDTIAWLEYWYRSNCDGEWEHGQNIRLETLDNPGWKLVIRVDGTTLEGEIFTPLKVDRTDEDWFYCSVQDGRFVGVGGASNLHDILGAFRSWVGERERSRT